MEICTGAIRESHEEIVYDSRECPLCVVIDKLSDTKKEIENFQDRIKKLETEIEELESS